MKKSIIKKILVVVILLLISVGYAYLSSEFQINGDVGYSKNTWDIHFDNIHIVENDIDASKPQIIDNTSLDFDCLFSQPGDVFEFTIDIVNDGTIDVMLDNFNVTALTPEQDKYLNYSVTYFNGEKVTQYDFLPASSKTKLNIKVDYEYDISEVPMMENVSLSLALNYVLADDSAKFGKSYWEFNSTSNVQEFIVPFDGTYLLEVWGSQGKNVYSGTGGYGGYASGNIFLNSGKELFVVVGSPGYNGGGDSNATKGGGATHIAYINNRGLLVNYENNLEELLIVAGGGGSAENIGDFGIGGSGGGYIGVSGKAPGGSGKDAFATGGTQNVGGIGSSKFTTDYQPIGNINGSFGLGGNGKSSKDSGPGGGGGLYGGGASTYAGAAGGGSGYIGNELLTNKVMYCFECEESTVETTKTISTTNVSDIAIANYAKIGNGYARITYLG